MNIVSTYDSAVIDEGQYTVMPFKLLNMRERESIEPEHIKLA